MIRRIREWFGPQVADEYQAIYDGLIVIRDYFTNNGLPFYADFFDTMLLSQLERRDCEAFLDALDKFEDQFNSFQQYQILFRGEVERLYRIQQELED